jgi:hypothetical protein
MDSQQIALITALKGAPASILWALILSGSPMGTNELATVTGWSKSQITAGLTKLASLDLAQRMTRFTGWQLTARVRQMVLSSTNSSRSTNDSNLITITTTTIGETMIPEGVVEEVSNSSRPTNDSISEEVIEAYKQTGITLNWRTRQLAKKITAFDVTHEFDKLRRRGKSKEVGLLITILEAIASGQTRHDPTYADWDDNT